MKVNLKDLNYKEFFLQNGEKVGLWVAGGLTVLIFILGTVWKGVFSESASANANTLRVKTSTAEDNIKKSRPDESLRNLDPALVKAVNPSPIDSLNYICKNPPFVTTIAEDTKWRKPEVVMPTEFMVETIRQLVPSYAIDNEGETVVVLVVPEKKAMTEEEKNRLQRDLRSRGRRGRRLQAASGGNAPATQQRPGPGQAPGGMGGMGGNMLGSQQFNKENEKDKELVPQVIRVDELNDKHKIMELPEPVKMVVITGEFPFRAQMEEFRRALRFASVDQLLASDAVCEFVGIEVERRFAGQGEEAWKPVNYVDPMKRILVRAVAKERENPQLLGSAYYPNITYVKRLVKALPKLARDQKYTDVAELTGIKNTLDEFKAGKVKTTAVKDKKSRFDEKDVDIDAEVGADDKGKGGGNRLGGGRDFGVGEEGPPRSKPGAAEDSQAESVLPEKCLVRFVDPTVDPGRTYEYRIRIVMSNPNYEREDKAVSKSLTEVKELYSQWKVIPKKVAFPPVQHVYAVDETGATSRRLAGNADRVAMQIHRWIERTRLNPDDAKTEVNVGDWSILERVLCFRGDYIGRREEVDLPVWNPYRDKFLLAQPLKKSARQRQPKGIAIDFTTDAVLVDFEGGMLSQTFTIGNKSVTDHEVPAEVLISENDGKLTLVRTSLADYENPERKKRLDEWQKWIKKVKEDTEGSAEKKKGDGLFNK